jgi:hypothetical protein
MFPESFAHPSSPRALFYHAESCDARDAVAHCIHTAEILRSCKRSHTPPPFFMPPRRDSEALHDQFIWHLRSTVATSAEITRLVSVSRTRIHYVILAHSAALIWPRLQRDDHAYSATRATELVRSDSHRMRDVAGVEVRERSAAAFSTRLHNGRFAARTAGEQSRESGRRAFSISGLLNAPRGVG